MKTVLILTTVFPPCTAYPTACARVRGLASSLKSFGWYPIIVAPEVGSTCCCEGCGGSEEARIDDDVQIVRVPVRAYVRSYPDSESPSYAAHQRLHYGGPLAWLVSKTRSLLRLVRVSMGNLEVASTWPSAAYAEVNEIIQNRRIDALWATCEPVSTLWVADKASRQHSLPWLADIRDALVGRWTLSNYKQLGILVRARRILRRAPVVVEVTPEYAAQDEAWLKRRCEVISSGFDPKDWANLVPVAETHRDSGIDLMCAGRLYPGRVTLAPILRTLSNLRAKVPGTDVRLAYYGRSTDLARREAREFDVDDIVECRGFVRPDELRRHLVGADVLVLLTTTAEHGPAGWSGAKLYEYLAARRPIVAVPCADEFVERALQETGAGFVPESEKELSEFLLEALKEKEEKGKVAYHGREDAVNAYSIQGSSRRLAEILDSLVESSVVCQK